MGDKNTGDFTTSSRITYKKKGNTDCHAYPLTSLILMFFCFAFLGWIWEITLHFFLTGTFINRGVLRGPWLPIYGAGSVLILVLLKRFQSKPFLCFGMSAVICGIEEYSTSWMLEKLFHATWWDYSNEFLNLHGRIYLLGLLFFGAAGCLIMYVLAPFLNQKFIAISKQTRIVVCVILGIIFIADLIFSMFTPNMGVGISKMI